LEGREPKRSPARLNGMLQDLLSVILETFISAAGGVVVKILGLESAVELVAAVAGLLFMAIGFAMWLGH